MLCRPRLLRPQLQVPEDLFDEDRIVQQGYLSVARVFGSDRYRDSARDKVVRENRIFYTLRMAKNVEQQESAWDEAAHSGCDMSLLEESLRRTPAERIRIHQRALQTVRLLVRAMESHGAAAATTDRS